LEAAAHENTSDIAGAVPFAFADGSVHLLPTTIDCTTLKDLFLRDDMAPVTIPTVDFTTVPEPSSLLLVVSGLAYTSALARRRK
jgi:hypothetical protein